MATTSRFMELAPASDVSVGAVGDSAVGLNALGLKALGLEAVDVGLVQLTGPLAPIDGADCGGEVEPSYGRDSPYSSTDAVPF